MDGKDEGVAFEPFNIKRINFTSLLSKGASITILVLDALRALAFCAGQEAKVEPNVVSYSAMIDACAKVGDAIRAQRWHQRMRISAHVYPLVFRVYSKPSRLWDE